MRKDFKKGYLALAIGCLLVLFGIGYYYFLTPFSCKKSTTYLYIDQDDNYDSLMTKLMPVASKHGYHAFCILSRHSKLTEKVRTGRYAIEPSTSTFTLFRHIKNGMQTPVSLTVPSVRTMEDMANQS